ncbi:unnamed protein product [Trichobilharzia regenti]|nr:unnamed protein product [Trichobilharzia regenti]
MVSLEEFRLNREALWAYYHNLELTLDQLKKEHKTAMENLLERDMAYRGRLKKVASEFRSVSFQRTEPTVKRMLAENVSIEGQLVKLSVAIAEMSRENVSLLKEFHSLIDEQSSLEKEQIVLGTRNSAVTKISHLLSIHQDKLDQFIREAEERNEMHSNLSSKCNDLQVEKQSLSMQVEISIDCTDSIHHLTNCIKSLADYIQTILSSNSDHQTINENCKTIEESGVNGADVEETKSILFKLYNQLDTSDCLVNKFDISHLERIVNQENMDKMNTEKNTPVDNDSLSEISEPNFELDIDENMSISEPEDNDIISVNNEPVDNLQNRLESQKSCLENMERLDKIWSQINASYLQSYNPGSDEWREILSILAKNQVNWSEKLRKQSATLSGGGYLRPGDLKFIPPPSEKILTKKEYMSLLKRRESKSSRLNSRLSNFTSDDINQRYSTLQNFVQSLCFTVLSRE